MHQQTIPTKQVMLDVCKALGASLAIGFAWSIAAALLVLTLAGYGPN